MDLELAVSICQTRAFDCFLVNDQIASFPGAGHHGVTLHPFKLGRWLREREERGFPDLAEVWCWKNVTPGVTASISPEWNGSSSLLAVRAAVLSGHTRVVLCGVPMDPAAGHFVRRRQWPEGRGFRRGWLQHREEIAPFVRSCSGWTRDMFGAPTAEWLDHAA